jgi:hypothetical protein
MLFDTVASILISASNYKAHPALRHGFTDDLRDKAPSLLSGAL